MNPSLHSCHDVELLLVERRKQRSITNSKLCSLEEKVKAMCTRLDAIHPFTAQQIAFDADKKVIATAFPCAELKPFCIRSFVDLLTFINNPINDHVTGPEAPRAWAAMAASEKDCVTEKVRAICRKFPYLRISIMTLKDCYDIKLNRAVISYREAVENFQDDIGIVECLACVHHFLFSDEAATVLCSIRESGSYGDVTEFDYSKYRW